MSTLDEINTDQERVFDLAGKIARGVIEQMDEHDKGRTFHTDSAFQSWLSKFVTDKLKLWAAGIVLAYAAPIILAAFYIGGMNEKLDTALRDQRANTQSLQARGGWMNDQERFNCDVRRTIETLHPEAGLGDCAFVSGQDRSDSRR